MEQKQTLWIIAAVGVFLLVVLGAAVIIYSPFTSRSSRMIAGTAPVEKNVSDGWISLSPTESAAAPAEPAPVPGNTQGQPVSKVDELTVFADNATIYGANVNTASLPPDFHESKPEQQVPPQAPQTVINNTTLIDLNTAPALSVLPEKPAVTPKTEPAKKAMKPAETPVTAKPVQTAVKPEPKTPVQVKASAVNTVKPPVQKKVTAEPKYWVQVTALTSKKSADNARSVLDENKIPADVFTYKDNKNQVFYRVRVGPYTTKSEAEYWRSKIVKIDDFSKTASYITTTKAEN